MKFSVRPATAADVSAICSIGQEVWPETYAFAGGDFVEHGLAIWWSEEAVRKSLATTTTLVAEAHGQIVGMGNVELRRETPVIWKLYVLPEHQGTGVGSALLMGLVASVPVERQLIDLEYVDGNDRASDFYTRNGFIEVRREPAEQSDWPDQVWMQRSLDS